MTYTLTHVKVEPAGLTVTASDATNEHFPANNTPGTPDEDGRQMYYRPVRMREAKWDLYCNKLGAAIARELRRADSNIVIPNDALTDLPEGYQIFEHVKNHVNDPKKYRSDTYLFGFGSIRFRSPAEFEDHLLWLASDQSTHCLCKYCSKDSTPRRRVQSTPQGSNQSNQRTPQSSHTSTTPPNQVASYSKSKTRALNNTQLPSNINYYSRNGEIVWIKTSLVLSESQLDELRNGKVKIEHWPGYVVERQKFSPVVNDMASGIHYKVQPLNIVGMQKASEDQVIPWLLLSSDNLVEKINKIKDDHAANQGTYSSTLMHVINLFCSARDTAMRVSKTYTALDSYKYTLPPFFLSKIEDSNERRLLQQMEKYTHYKTFCFGSEVLKEDDYVRMKDAESKGNNIRIFKINTIYENCDNKILFNGDIYLKAFGKVDKIKWSRLNEEDKEYVIGFKEISGRYYDTCPYINQSMEVNEAISLSERKELIERQETDKSNPSPSQPVTRKQTAKRSIRFDNPLDVSSKKPKVQNENTMSQQILQQDSQQEEDVPNNDESDIMLLDVDSKKVEVIPKVDPMVISPTIPCLDESENEISEIESNLFEMLSNHPEKPY